MYAKLFGLLMFVLAAKNAQAMQSENKNEDLKGSYFLTLGECCICLDPLSPEVGRDVVLCSCSGGAFHPFHVACLNTWYKEPCKSGQQKVCPLCNVPLVSKKNINTPKSANVPAQQKLFDLLEPREVPEDVGCFTFFTFLLKCWN